MMLARWNCIRNCKICTIYKEESEKEVDANAESAMVAKQPTKQADERERKKEIESNRKDCSAPKNREIAFSTLYFIHFMPQNNKCMYVVRCESGVSADDVCISIANKQLQYGKKPCKSREFNRKNGTDKSESHVAWVACCRLNVCYCFVWLFMEIYFSLGKLSLLQTQAMWKTNI